MSVRYYTTSNQPVFKTSFGVSPATTLKIWTPASGKSVVLTDICASGAAAGTIKFIFTTDVTVASNHRPIVEFVQAGSVVIKQHWDTPFVGVADEMIYVVAGGNGSVLDVTLSGFEQD